MTRHLLIIVGATVAAAAASARLEATGSASRGPPDYAARRSRSPVARLALLARPRRRDDESADAADHALRLCGGADADGIDVWRRVRGVDGWRRLRGGGDEGGERHEFKAEIKQLMSLIINAFYSNKEIFLRELISNAADAIDKIRHQALSDESALEADTSLHISLIPDEASKTLTIRDTGVGMTKAELEHNLGTIAHSGTKAFMEAMQQGKAGLPLIGQFGVGFYSAFLVADFVEVFSKSNTDSRIWRWASDAGGSFTIEEATYDELPRGTAVVLHLKDDQLDLLNPHKLRELVRLHSEFITHPIRLWLPPPPSPPPSTPSASSSTQLPPASTGEATASADAAAEADSDAATVEDVAPEAEAAADAAAVEPWETLNQQPPIWMQPPAELSDDDYATFYKAISGDFEEPLVTKHFSVEGQIDMRGLLFVPRRAPFDVFDREKRGSKLRLYVRRVFVSDDCDELCPEWLGFLRGVVDSDDLPLNVSREMLQQSSKLLQVMRRNIVKKAIEMLTELANADEDKYMHFYSQFSKNLKLGIHEEAAQREKLARLLRYRSSASAANQTSLAEYVSRMQPNQTSIYYIAGESVEAVADSPFAEPLRARGLEVLYMTDPIDEYAMQSLREFDGHRFVCITKAGLNLDPAEGDAPQPDAEEAARLQTLCNVTKKLLAPRVHRVTLSSRLSSSPCVLVTDEWGWSANMERIMRAQALRDPSAAGFMSSPKTLELNPRHPIVRQLAARAAEEAGSEGGGGGDGGGGGGAGGGGLDESVQLLYETALIGSGFSLDKPNAFTARIHKLMQLALTADTQPAGSMDGLRADAPAAAAAAIGDKL